MNTATAIAKAQETLRQQYETAYQQWLQELTTYTHLSPRPFYIDMVDARVLHANRYTIERAYKEMLRKGPVFIEVTHS